MADIEITDAIRAACRRAVEQACPTDEQCLADEDECFRMHPIHHAATRDGRLEQVWADVDGLVEVVLAAAVPLLRAQWEAERAESLVDGSGHPIPLGDPSETASGHHGGPRRPRGGDDA